MNKQLIAIIAIIGLSLVVSVKKEDCSIITCSSTDVSTDLGVCATVKKNANGSGFSKSLQTCKSGFYCPGALTLIATAAINSNSTATSNCIKDPNSSSLLDDVKDFVGDLFNKDHCSLQAAGEACSSNLHCLSGSCSSKKCSGTALDGSCTSDKNCNVGLFCNTATLKCATQKAENQTCIRDEECVNTHGCNNGKCIKYYSLADGAEATNPYVCVSSLIKPAAKPICDTRTLTTNKCSSTEDSCIYTYKSDNSASIDIGCQCDSTTTLSVSCPAATISKMDVYTNINTSLRWTGSCKSDYENLDSCVGETYYGALYTNSYAIFKVGFVLLAALMMLF